jgi:hypothetical protein
MNFLRLIKIGILGEVAVGYGFVGIENCSDEIDSHLRAS